MSEIQQPAAATTEKPKTRIFIADSRDFPDPDPGKTPEEILRLMVDFMPELNNAKIEQTEKDGILYISFLKTVGTKA